jgi:hypothetical protein
MINTPKSHKINFQADHLSQQYIIPMVTMIVAGTPAGQSGSAEQSAVPSQMRGRGCIHLTAILQPPHIGLSIHLANDLQKWFFASVDWA